MITRRAHWRPGRPGPRLGRVKHALTGRLTAIDRRFERIERPEAHHDRPIAALQERISPAAAASGQGSRWRQEGCPSAASPPRL